MAKKKATVSRASKKAVNDLIGDTVKPAPRKKPQPKYDFTPPATPKGELPDGYRLVRGVAIPPYPSNLATIEFGGKSTAVKEWYKQHHPEAYEALFTTSN